MSFILSLLALLFMTLIFLRERRLYIQRHDHFRDERRYVEDDQVAALDAIWELPDFEGRT